MSSNIVLRRSLIVEELVVLLVGVSSDDCFVPKEIFEEHATSGATAIICSGSSISFVGSSNLFSSMK